MFYQTQHLPGSQVGRWFSYWVAVLSGRAKHFVEFISKVFPPRDLMDPYGFLYISIRALCMNSIRGGLHHVTAPGHQPFQACKFLQYYFYFWNWTCSPYIFKHACSPYLRKFQECSTLHVVLYGYAYSDAMSCWEFSVQDSQRTTPRSDFGCHPLGSNTLVGKCALGPDVGRKGGIFIQLDEIFLESIKLK